jgi:hypothetical protein
VLLGDEHLHEIAQALLLLCIEQLVRRDIALEDRGPLCGERRLEQTFAAALGQPAQHVYSRLSRT